MLIDTHCHLYHDFGGKKPGALLHDAKLAGVGALITIGVDAATVQHCQNASDEFPEIFHSVGIHAHEASKMGQGDLALIEKAAANPKCVAIGEIGLDYYYDFSPKELQREVFKKQLELALKCKKPVIVHCRDAEQDVLSSLREYATKLPYESEAGVLHCFTGTFEFGKACLDLGFFISFSGVITFKNSELLRQAAREFPLERLLVETDSPYLAPVPFRGKKCEPSMVKATALKLAEIRGVPFEQIEKQTTLNAARLFKLPLASLEPIRV